MGGGMEVHKNRWIEEWNAGRENLEFNFRWTRRNLAVVGLFGLAVPILVYKGIVREFNPCAVHGLQNRCGELSSSRFGLQNRCGTDVGSCLEVENIVALHSLVLRNVTLLSSELLHFNCC
ncbi:uncharacterized protein LOC133919868 isoform X1 [Phragmites australis]|uniref:uncharacterized protein LOC133919868 isoform X1 n=1 Tax=Phragmites australis TaxID=29695 RepID=UPI002D798B6A|nr:uncharacterized protein LOC133919868 isoform X1 [Phragmites australis]